MKRNVIKIVINKAAAVIYDFALNPNNTPTWISSIYEEHSSVFPPEIGTEYWNRSSADSNWDYYQVKELEKNKNFLLVDRENNYHVRYTFVEIQPGQTELTYDEWTENGELPNPFTMEPLEKLKEVVEAIRN